MFIINMLFQKTLKNVYELIYISKNYYLRKSAYLIFFETAFDIDKMKELFMPFIPKQYIFSKRNKYIGLYNIIYDSFFVSKQHFLNSYYNDIFFETDPNIFRFSCLNFSKFLKFNYWSYTYESLELFNLNNLKSRIKIHSRSNNIKGYKMHLVGRFTRKQRASSYWFSRGKVPLSTVSALVDFAYYTVPLKNSAITVKVWLYKSSDTDNIIIYKLIKKKYETTTK